MGNNGRAYLNTQFAIGAALNQQTSVFGMARSITGTAQTELLLENNSNAILLSNNRLWNAKVQCSAFVSAAGTGSTVVAGDALVQSFDLGIKRVGTTTSLIGTVDTTLNKADANMAGATFAVDANDGNESLRIQFTPPSGASATTVTRCHCAVILSEVGY
jgi:hypothetical protein